ncbi:uncharacterized protein F5Z01DRAFT_675503 [Emericellopsis atlantica]|uniref:Uncharacterized protein n=1 Tax=Emericellopsis atlantica TaxID=2614577 RepID=A0A9P8CN46_9HYPO|nr:uncharacterized protein F5Z01DRAFT_675503 [Emericellopsis atlantica]KAG9253108.1 hypothetical protein F5Z01DRAFT_675503 [Emericellopsis atlantica]
MELTFLLVSVSVVAGCHIILSLVAGYLAWYYRKQWKRLQAQHTVDEENLNTVSTSRGRSQTIRRSSRYGTLHEEGRRQHTRDGENSREAGIPNGGAQRTRRKPSPEEFILSTFDHPRTPPKPPMPVKSAERGAKRASWSLAAEIAKIGESSKQPQAMENGKTLDPAAVEGESWRVGSPVSGRPLWFEVSTQDVQERNSQDGYI